MLRVTEKAQQELEKFLQKQKADPEVALRIISSPTKPNEAWLKFDKERAGDQVVESKEGRKLLLIQSDVATELEGLFFDHRESHIILVEEDIKDKMLDRKNFVLYLNDVSVKDKIKYQKQIHDTIGRFDKEFDRGGFPQKSTIVCELVATSFNQ